MGLDNEVPPTWSESDRTVILVSLDGFRHDYRARTATPALDRIVAEGVAAEGLIPVFPSKTFPNHVSQVTGLYPPEHGIVGNSFYDPDFGEVFDFDKTAAKWWLGEPIRDFIERYLNILAIVFVVVLVGGFVAVKYLL